MYISRCNNSMELEHRVKMPVRLNRFRKRKWKLKDGYLTDDSRRLMFSFKAIETYCGYELIYSSEGLYLSKHKKFENMLKSLNQTDKDRNTVDELIVLENDFRYLEHRKALRRLYNEECNIKRTMLRLLEQHEDKFFKLVDNNNNEVIMYTRSANIYVPQCTSINGFTLLEKVRIKNKLVFQP